MKSRGNLRRNRSGTVKFGLTIGSFLFAIAFAAAEPSPAKPPKVRPTPKPGATPKPSPTPDAKLDAKTEAELLQAEDRFIIAIKNGDAKALGELLHEGFADSFGRYASVATARRGILDRVGSGQVPAYRVIKDRKLSVSADLFTVEGLAHAERQNPGDEPWDEWFQVRRLWTKTEGRWLVTAQMITPVDKEAEDEKEKEKK
jgi:uncharacterized protein DUF4440